MSDDATAGAPWWRTLYAMHHRIWPGWSRSEAQSDETAGFLTGWLGLGPGDRALDMGCGVGREVAALSRRGLIADGVDISPELVADARARLADAGAAGSILEGDYRAVSPLGRYDLIYFWDSALNVFGPEAASAVLERARGWLKPGGWLLVEQLNPSWWHRETRTYSYSDPALGPGRTEREYRYDPASGRLLDEVTWHPPDGEPVALPVQRLRLFSPDELRAIVGAGAELAGSDGWSWSTPPRPADDPESRSTCARWRAPLP